MADHTKSPNTSGVMDATLEEIKRFTPQESNDSGLEADVRNLGYEEIQNAGIQQIIVWLKEYGDFVPSPRQHQLYSDADIDGNTLKRADYIRERRNNPIYRNNTFRLIERLAEFDELQDLTTKGVQKADLERLVELFEPLNYWGFNLIQNVPNKHKLYERVMVKVTDIEISGFGKKAFKHIQDSPYPKPELFKSATKDGDKIKVDYFVSLINTKKTGINHIVGGLDMPRFEKLDKKAARTLFYKFHVNMVYDGYNGFKIYELIQILAWVFFITLHILCKDDEDSDYTIMVFIRVLVDIQLATSTNVMLGALLFPCAAILVKSGVPQYYRTVTKQIAAILFDFQQFCALMVILCMTIYQNCYFNECEEESKQIFLSLASFFAYVRLMRLFQFFKKTRELVHTIIQIAKRSLDFLLIVVVFIFGITFSRLALAQTENFGSSFQESFGLSFGNPEDAYSSTSGFLGYVVFTYSVPLLLLNLLITIMSDIQDQVQDNWETEEVQFLENWAFDQTWNITLLMMISLPFLRFDFGKWLERTGHYYHYHKHIHYVRPKVVEEDGDFSLEDDQWRGHVKEIRGSIIRAKSEIIRENERSRCPTDLSMKLIEKRMDRLEGQTNEILRILKAASIS